MGHDHGGTDSLGSGNSEDYSHGLQLSGVYWETGHRTYVPFWSKLVVKFTPKIIDDQLRRLLGHALPVAYEPFVFYGHSGYFRSYLGDPDVSTVHALRRRTNFSFYPTGGRTLGQLESKLQSLGDYHHELHEKVFREVLHSAKQLDMSR
ncbi:hypothetical protein BBOV_I002640 [Babesia bovis T2Bo]|uniref:Uncharacterized protein n=1 Tax=Babesia bovis TaxID=5865 RepID=A7AWB8_BABBO|nr:hypothetical protein BBOV_I002640 [Babesia bovis T2Bo]EDO05346.1 hypothetical protein BBOV_I002640 [Babesia bovis T2Bo]|eukprot:XP_001608914.1 hypothetical protein [Babesia bovis T2Bo]